MDQLIEIRGKRLFVRSESPYPDRPVIVFLHDSLGCVELWRDFPARLAEATRCNVLIYDRLGYGQSDPMPGPERTPAYLEHEADVLEELLDRCGVERAILFGHSDGATIALVAAAKHPARIEAVISEAAHIFVEEETLAGIRDAQHAWATTNLKSRVEKYHGPRAETVYRAWIETWLSPEYRAWNIESCLPSIHCPLLVMQGEKDEYGTLRQVEGIVSQVSGPVIKSLIPGVGHTPHKEAMGLTLRAAADFINGLLPASQSPSSPR